MTVIQTGWVGLNEHKFFENFDIFTIFFKLKMKTFYITFAWLLDWASLDIIISHVLRTVMQTLKLTIDRRHPLNFDLALVDLFYITPQ